MDLYEKRYNELASEFDVNLRALEDVRILLEELAKQDLSKVMLEAIKEGIYKQHRAILRIGSKAGH